MFMLMLTQTLTLNATENSKQYCVRYVHDSLCPLLICRNTQEERMDELNLFIEHYSKYTVSIIWQTYVFTLHLFHINCSKAFNV